MDRYGELALLPLGDEEAGRLLASVPDEKRGECWWLELRDGTTVAGDEGGGVMLLAEVRLTRPLGRALRAVRLSPVSAGNFELFVMDADGNNQVRLTDSPWFDWMATWHR